MTKTFEQYVEENKLDAADRLMHSATWNEAISAAAKSAAECRSGATMSKYATLHEFEAARQMADKIYFTISALATE